MRPENVNTSHGSHSSVATRCLADLPGPRGLPLLGNALSLAPSQLHATLERWCDEYGSFYGFGIGPMRCIALSDGELIRRLFRERPDNVRRMHTMESVARELGMHGVFSAEGEDWKRQRKLINPAFKEENLSASFVTLRAITQRFTQLLTRHATSGEPIDILHHLMRYTVDVTIAVSFGQDVNTLERGPDALQRHVEVIFPMLVRRVNAPFPYWRYLKLPADRALDAAVHEARSLLVPFIESARERLASDPTREPDTLLEAMLLANDPDSASAIQLSNDELIANLLTLLLAGEDTTANLLAWLFYDIAENSDVQIKLQAEADSVLGADDMLANALDAQRLRYLGAVTHETLRMRSSAPFVALEAKCELVLNDVAVPAGTPMFMLTRKLATAESSLREPLRFLPERWLDPDPAARAQLVRNVLPFGAGPRFCPGRQLALLECSLLMSSTLKRFTLRLPPGLHVTEHFDFAMEPKGLSVLVGYRDQ